MYGLLTRLFLLVSILFCVTTTIVSQNVRDDDLPTTEEKHPYFDLFITERMKHLIAVRDIKGMKSDVKRYQLVSDLVKEIVHVLNEERRKREKISNPDHLENYPDKDIIKYLEKTAFFCDLLVFFPHITLKLLDAHLLWRVTLIDSIQDVTFSNLKVLDENTLQQFDKAYQLLSEGILPKHEEVEQKTEEAKKPKRKPRLYSNEL